MLKSMTGFGQAKLVFEEREITAEIKSVNHRYFEFTLKAPRVFSFLEDTVKKAVSKRVPRGKIDVYLNINQSNKGVLVQMDSSVVKSYLDAARSLNEEFSVENDLTASRLLTLPEVISITKDEQDAEVITSQVLQVLELCMDDFSRVTKAEGENLGRNISDMLGNIASLAGQIVVLSPQSVAAYRERLAEKMSEVLGQTGIEESRILTEAAIFSEKVAVDEELVRIKSHLSQFDQLVKAEENVGKKMDFLIQELNREANTIGSKCNDINISKLVIELKSEIEKIREQIQNIA